MSTPSSTMPTLTPVPVMPWDQGQPNPWRSRTTSRLAPEGATAGVPAGCGGWGPKTFPAGVAGAAGVPDGSAFGGLQGAGSLASAAGTSDAVTSTSAARVASLDKGLPPPYSRGPPMGRSLFIRSAVHPSNPG